MNLAIGIDTGGTYTDAVLYDFDAGRIVQSAKTLTTHRDLTGCILRALDALNPELCRRAGVAGISTTLATNACVEEKFRKTRLLLMGIDREGIRRFGKEYGLTDPDDICYLPCRTSITGEIFEEPDWELLRTHAEVWFQDVESCAVCEIYGIRNGGVLEKRAAEILEEETGLPVVCASSLFSGLSSLERAAGALLNAGLMVITREFLDAVRTAFRQRGIRAEVFVVRSDSSLMSVQYSAAHAVETLLSGPASSALGGSVLSGQQRAIVVDMGGTTTDIALIENGIPVQSAEGIRVGKWKTQVQGLWARSFALGGDSAVRWDRSGNLTIGPERVIPLCVLAARHPEVRAVLERLNRQIPVHTLPLHEFLTLNRDDWRTLPLEETDARLCRALERGPLNVLEAARVLDVDKYLLNTGALEKRGILLRSGLTPTDIMHVRGDYTQYDVEAARLAAQFVSHSLHTDLDRLGQLVYERISREIFCGVSRMLLEYLSPYYDRKKGESGDLEELLRLQWENRNADAPLFQCAFHTNARIVGIGGPIHLFLKDAALALGTDWEIPEHAPVANAVGAVTGQVRASAAATVRAHGQASREGTSTRFEVLCEGEPPHYFDRQEEAVAWTEERLRALTEKRIREKGAVGEITYEIERKEQTVPLGTGEILLGTRLCVTASVHFIKAGGRICAS